jgi:hypothetical protein
MLKAEMKAAEIAWKMKRSVGAIHSRKRVLKVKPTG